MTGLVARCSSGVTGGRVSLDSGYSCLRAWRATREGGGDGEGGGGGVSDVLPGDWRFRRSLAAQLFGSAASGLPHRVCRVEKADAELSFAANRLLEGEIRVFRGRVHTGVLTSDWRFRRPPAVQPFSSSASGQPHRVCRIEKADTEL